MACKCGKCHCGQKKAVATPTFFKYLQTGMPNVRAIIEGFIQECEAEPEAISSDDRKSDIEHYIFEAAIKDLFEKRQHEFWNWWNQ